MRESKQGDNKGAGCFNMCKMNLIFKSWDSIETLLALSTASSHFFRS